MPPPIRKEALLQSAIQQTKVKRIASDELSLAGMSVVFCVAFPRAVSRLIIEAGEEVPKAGWASSAARSKMICQAAEKFREKLAGELGFEPRQTESESVVLPLHHSPRITQQKQILIWYDEQSAARFCKSRESVRRSTR
jgi:hypothetical protein